MIRSAIIAMACFGLFSVQACSQSSEKGAPMELKTQKDKASYSIGVSIGKNLKDQKVEIQTDILVKGLLDAYTGAKTQLTEKEMGDVLAQFQQEIMAKAQEEAAKKGGENKSKGEKFLADNKNKPGVKTTPSGLQYTVISEGTGPKPTASSTVKVHYTGKLIDGTTFDSSVDRGEPIEFPLNGVIKGWTEGVQLMSKGSKYKFFIPSDLAYGDRGAGNAIGPNETLVFEVELLDIVK
ncbi:MAG: FKBP-type peptidyl-prolyl cis-trans isomerase [Ignavibacteriae bacterium]|jgi:FKBP-type peptidyl-prolyl cis-trans isomerase FklB|nr:FKBP-type peptidyl-prolyl cis-trans isomerase [Ignavibacteriota bacterium]